MNYTYNKIKKKKESLKIGCCNNEILDILIKHNNQILNIEIARKRVL